jgi:hypothetical protein
MQLDEKKSHKKSHFFNALFMTYPNTNFFRKNL